MRKEICNSSEGSFKIDKQKSTKFFQEGNRLYELKEYDEAIRAYNRAIKYAPQDYMHPIIIKEFAGELRDKMS